ncbi:MAG: hxuA 2, partial [Gammaproteobacteria bacterium]|nr:hxuA 2 [Gammaproteobacteria bacterium]
MSSQFRKWSVFLATVILVNSTYANPVDGVVSSGSATITAPDANTVVVNQTSDKAVINWQSFNISAQEKTQFIQPNASSIALNRIDPQQGASQIFGQLQANGKIILINQSGVFFGPGSMVNVGSIIASTVDIADQSFLTDNYNFDQPLLYNGSIINQGTIIAAQHGLVALLGSAVSNEGMIQAHLGQIVLGSGSQFMVGLDNTGLVNFAVNAETTKSGAHAVNNSGNLIADGGTIILTAKAAKDVVDRVINMTGVAEAKSVAEKNGEIILQGDDEGITYLSGKLDASGYLTGQTGGVVKVLGNTVALDGHALIDVSGDVGGGTALIGGNAYGAGPEQNANYTFFGSDAKVLANALTHGNGGKVVVWANGTTEYYGDIYARGSIQGGNGGWIETSGKENLIWSGGGSAAPYLGLDGMPLGANGTWLFDPRNVTISDSPTDNGSFAGSGTSTFTPSGNNAIVLYTDIQNLLNASTNVIITTGITGGQAGDITIGASITWTSGAFLTLNALGAITSTGGSLITNTTNSSAVLNLISGGVIGSSGTPLGIAVPNLTLTTTNSSAYITSTTGTNFGASNLGTGSLSYVQTGAGGNITQTGAITAGTLAATLTSGALNFNSASNAITNLGAITAPGGFSLTNGNNSTTVTADINTTNNPVNINVGTGTYTQNDFDIITGSGAITITGNGVSLVANTGNNAFQTTGILTLKPSTASTAMSLAGASTFDLTAAEITALSGGVTGAGSIVIGDSSASTGTLNVGGAVNFGAKTVSLYAGNYTSPATSTITAGTLNLTARNVSGAIGASGGTNAMDVSATNLSFNTNTNGNAYFSTGAISLGASLLRGLLVLNSTGAITQTGALNVIGPSIFSAGANPITLTNTGNVFTSAMNLNNSGANDVSVTSSGVLDVGTSNIGRNLSLTAGGNITQLSSGAWTVPGTTTLAVTVPGSDILIGTVAFTSNLTGAVILGGTLTNIRDFSLRNSNAAATVPNLTGVSNLRNLTLNFTNAAAAIAFSNPITVLGNLTATGTSISQTGALTVAGQFTGSAANGIVLTNAGNAMTNFNATNTSSGNIQLTNTASTLTLSGLSQAGTGL